MIEFACTHGSVLEPPRIRCLKRRRGKQAQEIQQVPGNRARPRRAQDWTEA